MAKKKNRNSDLNKINNIIHKSFFPSNQTSIIEVNRDTEGKKFEMRRTIVPHSSIHYSIYRFDPDEKEIFPFFSSISGLNKICDYMIFVEKSSNLFILLIELKKGKNSPCKQLEASECFANYILESAKRISMEIERDVQIRKIGLSDNPISKKNTTAYYRNASYDSNRYIKIQGYCDLRLVQLIDLTIKNS